MRLGGIVIAAAALLVTAQCSSCGGGSGSALSSSQALALAGDLSGAMMEGAGSLNAKQPMPADFLKREAARIRKATSNGGVTVPAAQNTGVDPESISCNSNGTSCIFNEQLSYSVSCQTGGTIGVSGDLSGTGTQSTADISLQVDETINKWTCDGPTINGDPMVTLTGTFDYPSGPYEMTLSGGFTAGSQSCQLNVQVNMNADGSGDVSGTICGEPVSGSF